MNRRYTQLNCIWQNVLRKVNKARRKGEGERWGEVCVKFWVCFTYGSRRSHHSCIRTISAETKTGETDTVRWHLYLILSLWILCIYHLIATCNNLKSCVNFVTSVNWDSHIMSKIYIHNVSFASRFYSTDGNAADNHRRVFLNLCFIISVFCKTWQTRN